MGAKESSMKVSYSEVNYSETNLSIGKDGITMSSTSARSFTLDLEIHANDGVVNKEVEISLGQSLASTMRVDFSKEMSEKQKLLDPIVIDFDGNGVELADKKFAFDLDSDGRKDQISMLKKGSAYLALDRNNNGKIDNGNELFGTKSGDGFKDLGMYDLNRDAKIDANDDIYDKLRVWRKDESGADSLVALGEAGVGVIHLNPTELKNSLYDSTGNLAGIAQRSAAVEFLNGANSQAYHLDLVAGQTCYSFPSLVKGIFIVNIAPPSTFSAFKEPFILSSMIDFAI
eukprot:TRINITY_DN7350_c0_g1_i1.p1 TRINITY_DN7350_c0_g1~~TRINITY_DN7350_c0_g1_i1.p1  ORF type:complete len:286 (+),score=21.35 TRINITY_DN7350_c0_g1_i1:3-860(+)